LTGAFAAHVFFNIVFIQKPIKIDYAKGVKKRLDNIMQLLGGCIRRRCGRSWHQLEVVLSVPAHFLRTAALMDAVRDGYARATAHARACNDLDVRRLVWI
jgi:hypothetical protein